MKLLLRVRNYGQTLFMSLVALFVLLTVTESYAQPTRPLIPVLSLLGDFQSYSKDYYPDGRIWVAPSVEGAREFLLPVFITNNWYNYANQGIVRYQIKPITSFEFSIFYNEDAVRAIGVETINPSYSNETYDPLAINWSIQTDDKEDDYYWYYINPAKWASSTEKTKGRRITIAASNAQQLPNTDLINIEYKVLLYVRFRVIATNAAGGNDKFNKSTPIYIDNRMVRYNETNLATDRAYKNMINYDIDNYIKDYGTGPVPVGDYIDGLNNAPLTLGGSMQDETKWNLEPNLPGTATLRISDEVPEFSLGTISGDVLASNDEKSLWELDRFISVDSNSATGTGNYVIKITNKTSTSRISNISIESDSPWLTFTDAKINGSKTIQAKGNVKRNAVINYIDNGILGTSLNDPMDKPTTPDKDAYLEVICDPTKLDKNEKGDKTGIHVGYITFKSPSVRVNPIRLKVIFIFIRNPFEPDFNKVQGNPGGITLSISDHNANSLNIVFGTGVRATDGVDNLFGEWAYNYPLSTTAFDARWYPYPANDAIPNGFGDFSPNVDKPRSVSRDIRNYNLADTVNSYTYWCKFNPGQANSYPIKVQWDTRDFPEGGLLYIRQVVNGELLQATDMRSATSENEFIKSYSIFDPSVTEFVIEYTLPQSFKFVDANGKPIIKRGWNLLSLPLQPTNTKWNVVYPNAINIPWAFINSQYQQREVLAAGEGYFVKYPDLVDTHFAGAVIKSIGGKKVKVYAGDAPDPGTTSTFGGWNLIGALSVPTSVTNISFDPSANNSLPTAAYTLKYGVYGYKTDRGYFQVSELLPGLGYWIKSETDGFLKLGKTSVPNVVITNSDVLNASTKLTIRDNSQKETEVYVNNNSKLDISTFELPPCPPMNLFDVRFDDNKVVSTNEVSTIKFQGATFPVSIAITNADADYTFVDAVSGKVYGSILAGTSSNVVLKNLPFDAVKVMKKNIADVTELSVATNPNPATNYATVSYTVPSNDEVLITLIDAMGNTVKTILNETKVAGTYYANLDLSDVITGNYICKIVSGSNTSIVILNVAR